MNPVKNLQRISETALGLLYPKNCTLTHETLDQDNEIWIDRKLIEKITRITYPLCLHCGRPYKGAMESPRSCANCAGLKLYFDSARAFARTDEGIRDMIHSFKYQDKLWLKTLFGQWITQGWEEHFADQEFDAVVPVPIHSRKWRERGFNQAKILAQALHKSCGIPILDCLSRSRDTSSQTTFSRQKRFTNLNKSFKLSPKAKVQEMSLLLVDDVLTTGATASECARALKEGGTRKVHVLTIARG